MQLKIISWNIWYDGHFDEISLFLKASEADIIGLQEVVPDDPARDTICYLTELGYKHVFSPALKLRDGRTLGNSVFSKHEIIKNDTYVLSGLSENDSRKAVRADIKAGETTLHVFSTHLLHTHQQPSDTQVLQAENLIKFLPPDHTIVMGDFNATPESATIRKMGRVLVNTDPASTPTWSVYPEGCPTCNPRAVDIKLDYIFTSKDLQTHSFKVEASKGSDHLPISVIIEIL